jgi:hypothetical protein
MGLLLFGFLMGKAFGFSFLAFGFWAFGFLVWEAFRREKNCEGVKRITERELLNGNF